MTTQSDKAQAFRALHEGDPFVIPNPWDAGSARVFEALGFEALATTSSGFAFTLGRLDGNVTLDEVVEHFPSTRPRRPGLPVSVDLENGFGPDPEHAAAAIARVAQAGAVGGSIEDWDPDGRLYEPEHAAERVTAAVEAARGLDFPFTLTARAQNHRPRRPRTSTTRSPGSRATPAPAPTCCTRPASPTATRSARSATRSRSPSTSWRTRGCR